MEEKETRNDLLFSLILLVLLAWTSGFYIGELSEKQNTETVTDTVTVVTHDTIHSLQPVEVVRYVYRTKVDYDISHQQMSNGFGVCVGGTLSFN